MHTSCSAALCTGAQAAIAAAERGEGADQAGTESEGDGGPVVDLGGAALPSAGGDIVEGFSREAAGRDDGAGLGAPWKSSGRAAHSPAHTPTQRPFVWCLFFVRIGAGRHPH